MSADYVFGLCAVVLVAASPLLRRFYMDRYWIHGRGTIVRLDGAINTNPGAATGWVWTPIIEYHASGQRFSSSINYWQRVNAKPAYAAGDEVDIIYDPKNPSRVMLDSWTSHIFFAAFISALIVAGILHQK